jgi:stearoyl-CoA desaturase (Delta-9 desaturase)
MNRDALRTQAPRRAPSVPVDDLLPDTQPAVPPIEGPIDGPIDGGLEGDECEEGAAPATVAPPRKQRSRLVAALCVVRRWFDSWDGDPAVGHPPGRIDWMRIAPFIALHASVLLIPLVGWSPVAVIVAAALYFVRMFAITAFYHRYFSHRTFKMQFVFALLGNSAVQRGPLWWAAHHREHHAYSDTSRDPHSALLRGFWWSHCGWFLSRENFKTRLHRVRDLARFPELCFLDRFDVLVPLFGAGLAYGVGELLRVFVPSAGTNGVQLLVWSVVSTIVLFHATFTINSLSHMYGTRPFDTSDQSRNNPWLAILTLGEGWHNNHHHYPATVRQGFRWYEYDVSWWGLLALRSVGLIWDLKPVPARVLEQRRPRRLRH